MTTPLAKPHKTKHFLVEFSYGDPVKKVRYTDANADLHTAKGFFLSRPGMEVKLPTNTIGLGDKGVEVTLPIEAGDTFAEEISKGKIFPPTWIKVFEIVKREPPETDQILTPFVSRLSVTHRNPSNRKGAVRFLSVSPKARFKNKLGVQCNPQCDHRFGDGNCGFDLSTIEETGTLTIVGGFQVQITGLSPVTPLERPYYFLQGWVSFDGLSLTVFNWDAFGDQEIFTLERQPPSYWDGEQVIVTPGCLRTETACREWGRIERFQGPGIRIPEYNPVFEFQEEG